MFNYLYKKYKVEVLKTSTWLSIKELKLYEKLSLVMVILGSILSGVFTLIKNDIGSYISLVMIIIGFVLIFLLRSRKKEQQRIMKEIIEPSANERMQKVVRLLVEFGIDILDEEHLNNLIEQAKKEQDAYDVWKGFKKSFSGMTTYILLPIITILISEFFKEVGWETLLVRAAVLLMICTCIVLITSAFALNFNDILNPDIKNLNYFIKDVEDVKIFKAKAKNFEK
ncbi:hypothetical protein GCWU000282_03178 [Catonella morbi ATCC 51271]|uniref:Uncharacterized protein n=1 Tax=Catonella morbi ATCC 51271 TaxID=592026 RepID=V2Y0P9_9FIRM|nr:hypothetical protein [Catonella morbi]ESL01617.1 hypothetical protein GCWU000282_03178 [Catonella morbi ATCC 51271]